MTYRIQHIKTQGERLKTPFKREVVRRNSKAARTSYLVSITGNALNTITSGMKIKSSKENGSGKRGREHEKENQSDCVNLRQSRRPVTHRCSLVLRQTPWNDKGVNVPGKYQLKNTNAYQNLSPTTYITGNTSRSTNMPLEFVWICVVYIHVCVCAHTHVHPCRPKEHIRFPVLSCFPWYLPEPAVRLALTKPQRCAFTYHPPTRAQSKACTQPRLPPPPPWRSERLLPSL